MSDMLKILQGLDSVEKKTLNESAIAECGMTAEAPAAAPVSINITGDVQSMAAMLRLMGGAGSGADLVAPVAGAFQDDPAIPGRDDIEGDTDLNAGIIGTTIGAGLGGAAGMALGGPMGALTGGLAGAAAGDQLTDEPFDDPEIPGRDDVEGDTDLQAGALDSLAGVAGDLISKGSEIGANLGSKAAGAATDALGPDTMRRLAGMGDMAGGAAADALGVTRSVAQNKGAEIGSTIGKGAVAIGAPAAAAGAVSALGNDDEPETEDYTASTEPDEKYADHDMMVNKLSGGINRKKKAYAKSQDGDNAMAVEADDEDDRDELTKKLFPRYSREEWEKRQNAITRAKTQKQYMKPGKPSRSREWGAYESADEMRESMKARLLQSLEEKKAKPDFLDVDKDGDKKEPMKKAIADKKKGAVKEAVTESADITRMKEFLQRLNG